MSGDVVLSGCGKYRYVLARTWTAGGPTVVWVMLNPSTADADFDDPTIRRVVAFSKAWGFGRARVVNLFALRSTDPRAIQEAQDQGLDAIGPETDRWIAAQLSGSDRVVAAWGVHGLKHESRVSEVMSILGNLPVKCLGLTKRGAPRHPLYVSAATPLEPYRQLSSGAGGAS